MRTLCKLCQEELFLLVHAGRCGFCFQQKETGNCPHCRGQPRFCDYKAASFELTPAITTLIKNMKKNGRFLSSSLASFLFLQLQDLDWPNPDYITYVPHHLSLFNPLSTIAAELGAYLNVPVVLLLQKKTPTLRQHNLLLDARRDLSYETFSLKRKHPSLAGKTILIIDDYMVSGKTLECCAHALLQEPVKRIYGLTIAMQDLS